MVPRKRATAKRKRPFSLNGQTASSSLNRCVKQQFQLSRLLVEYISLKKTFSGVYTLSILDSYKFRELKLMYIYILFKSFVEQLIKNIKTLW